MKPLSAFTLALLACLISSICHAQQPTNSHRITPEPSWVLPRPTLEQPLESATNGAGALFLEVDLQVHLESQSIFRRQLKRVYSETGVQNESAIEFRYEPSHESLELHKLQIRRNGEVLDRLNLDKLRVIQQEKDSYRHIYNGELVVLAILEDVRVGDEIDYSYTVRGFNPIFGGRWSGTAWIDFSVPVQENRIRIVTSPDRPELHHKVHQKDSPPEIRKHDDRLEYLWRFTGLEPLDLDDRLPAWFQPYGEIQFSEFGSWADVRDWALPHYDPQQALPPEADALIARIQSDHKTLEAQALAALRFVQDEVRYVGLEIGANSHQPHDPKTVLARRFGDCKDKTILLCALLNRLGIKAHAAFVNTYFLHKTDERLPSPLAFNHAIVRAELNAKSYWLDPTLSLQRGTLDEVTADYGRALVISASEEGLATIPQRTLSEPSKTVNERLIVHAYEGPGELEVETIYTGEEANSMRKSTAEYSIQELQKDYLNYYRRLYSSVSNSAPLRILDDPVANKLTTIEKYYLKVPWPSYEDKSALFHTSFEGTAITELARHPSTYERKMPLGVRFPLYVRHLISIDLPAEGAIDSEEKIVEDEAQWFRFAVKQTGKILLLSYDYKTRADSVPVQNVSTYLENLDEIHELATYTASFPKSPSTNFAERINWPILGLAIAATLILLFGAWKYYTWHPTPPPPPTGSESLNGLRGWLLLVGFGLLVSPYRLAVGIYETLSAYEPHSWHYLTNSTAEGYHPLFAPLLIGELLGNLTLLVTVCLLLALFFQKRSTFPLLYILFLSFSAAFLTADLVGMKLIPSLAKEMSSKDYREVIRACAGGTIWIAYMLKSVRVKATFIR